MVEPELLDELAPEDTQAQAARRDLQRLNRVMGHARLIATTLIRAFPATPPEKLAELGCGDGTLMLAVVRRLPRTWGRLQITLVDRHPAISAQTLAEFGRHGHSAEVATADVFDWLSECSLSGGFIANLFLHHFEPAQLSRLFSMASQKCNVFLACEPRRSEWRWLASHCTCLFGANAVTQHDAAISVRAGFNNDELTRLWPRRDWDLQEMSAGLFSHLFVARRLSPCSSPSP